MIDVIYDYDERVSQIEKYLNLILILDNISDLGDLSHIKGRKIIIQDGQEILFDNLINSDDTFRLDTGLIKILKSNTILLLYNLIEGTISAVLNEFFGTINRDRLKYSVYKNEIKQVWIKYKHRSFSVNDKKDRNYIVTVIENILEEIVEISPKTIRDHELGNKLIYNYEAYLAETQNNEISGNLDARKIRELFQIYGLPELNVSCDSMVKIKNKRNSLAHGNETFAQVGGNFTVQELFNMKNEVTHFLSHLLNMTKKYLEDKSYLITTPIEESVESERKWWQRLFG